MPAIASKQAPAETPNVVIPEATPSSEEAKEMLKAEKPVSETAAPNITEPVVEEQPIFADTEAGTDHSGPELANKADNTEADKHVEGTKTEEGAKTTEEVPKLSKTKEDKKDIKKSAVKEKTEKTKAEGKGFFAKFFGNKDKSPKKEKKKTPKAEKADPVIAAAPIETKDGVKAAPQSVSTATEPAIDTAPPTEAVEPAVESPEAGAPPIVIDTATAPADAPAEAVPTPEENKIAEKKDEVKDHAGKPNLKAHRRLSARIGDIFKPKKKEDIPSPKEEIAKDEATAPLNEEPPVVASEAPKLEEPVATAPLNLEEEHKTAPPPAAAPVAASA
ncbi:hypothetical protein I307_06424 [Cryptococcus deuterogattii 99/473]|uniref:Unplaced genomic scaffold supercont1.1, whole genome shotgun sequence n=1 Tax=Cryptococcus deuterogattii Ram5 TaxID=1296110 RepID=A0A0D0V821_9TREE|nr:hypothetical protein I313_00413 [Cryptococcus deuterogattii Ram5]KIY54249.1 hypothetical protein I307_06424 [Cryptococcus deuterogattii 99/473]